MAFVYKRRCPHCKSRIRSDASACPKCTREVPASKWIESRQAKWVIALGVLFVLGTIGNMGGSGGASAPSRTQESPTTSAALQDSGSRPAIPATPVSRWSVSESKNEMDGSTTVSASIDADGEIKGWLKSTTPTLIIRCKENKTDAYIDVGMSASVESGDLDLHTVRLRYDDSQPVSESWSESTDNEALFARNAVPFAKRLAAANVFRFQFTPFNANPVIAAFDVAGAADALARVAKQCGWSL